MVFIEIHDVGYGECIIFEGIKNEILMVDCGSMNINIKNTGIKFKDYVTDFIIPRYKDADKKSFLLTHFHRDHICGFKYILKKEKDYFNTIYIPYPPVNNDNRALLLEMAVYVFVFLKRQQACTNMSTSAMFIFEFLSKNSNAQQIRPLKKGDAFEFSSVKYNVLNPIDKNFVFSQDFINIIDRLDNILLNSTQKEIINKFFKLKDYFCNEYINCSKLCIQYGDLKNEFIIQSIEKLNYYIRCLNNLSREIKQIDVISDLMSFLNSDYVNIQYSKAQNSSSIVFQNDRQSMTKSNDIIMTGDVTNEILDSLESEFFNFYNVIKAPHHGTSNYQNNVLNMIECSHILISNGDYHAGGKISKNYSNSTAVKHCTGIENCCYFKENNSCCNRLVFCDALKSNGDLTSHCDKKSISTGTNRCGIYVVSVNGDRGCYCD